MKDIYMVTDKENEIYQYAFSNLEAAKKCRDNHRNSTIHVCTLMDEWSIDCQP